jgi:hypothetical protein
MSEIPDTPAAAITRARCQYAELVIGGKRTREQLIGGRYARLDPVIEPDGRLNSVQSISPATSGGGSILVVVEALHAETCPALAAERCACGAQRLLEGFVFG